MAMQDRLTHNNNNMVEEAVGRHGLCAVAVVNACIRWHRAQAVADVSTKEL